MNTATSNNLNQFYSSKQETQGSRLPHPILDREEVYQNEHAFHMENEEDWDFYFET